MIQGEIKIKNMQVQIEVIYIDFDLLVCVNEILIVLKEELIEF